VRRGGNLTRTKPLETRTALKRITALNASPVARSSLHAAQAERQAKPRVRRPKPQIPTRVRVALAVRSGGVCEIAMPGCTRNADDASHRIKVGMGGRKGDAAKAHHVLSNLLAACRTCHGQRLHAEPARAYAAGWMLREHQIPTSEPVLYRGARCWLSDDGLVLNTNPHNAEEATQP
jgi:5-methylcytosine-specific restriction enzyme A